MTTQSTGDILAARLAHYKQKQEGNVGNNSDSNLENLAATASIFTPNTDIKTQPIIIKPIASTWEALEKKLEQVINLPGLWITVRKLYDDGYGAELETAAEIAQATHKMKSPYNLFAAMVSKKSGNWETRTLKMVQQTWEVRRNALTVMDKLNLKTDTAKAILAIAWRLKSSIIRFLGIATEQGVGIKNPTGLFFALTKKPKPEPGAA